MQKILLIGAKGMLGQYLAKTFAEDDLYLWDRDEIDITKPEVVKAKISELRPQVIINAAAYNDVDGTETQPAAAELVNGYGPGFLARAAEAVEAILVHYSSDYVFDGEKEEGYTESDQPNPISRYGASKYLGERAVRENCQKYYLIRLSRLFGSRGIGQGVKMSFVDKMLELAETRNQLEVVDEELSCPTYARDLAEYTRALLGSGEPWGVYHGANSGGCTWYQFAQEIFKLKDIEIDVIPVSGDKFLRPARRPRYSILLNTKFIPVRSWQEALEEYLVES
ncbi:dTDP-4-dehydrorhamnose reductase [Candidatus Falkowbacteria bacterium]|nr:dTDP-4-dehydrorhamnose reductase [Candidatus Falkowbacteria bacterium]